MHAQLYGQGIINEVNAVRALAYTQYSFMWIIVDPNCIFNK